MNGLKLRSATPEDTATILRFINLLAEYERLAHEAVATEEGLREELFGPRPAAEVVLAERDGAPVGFASSSTISAPSWGARGFTWRIFSCFPSIVAKESGGRSSLTLRELPLTGTAAVSNGPFSTGTSPPSASTERWEPSRWMIGRSSGSRARRWPALRGGDPILPTVRRTG